MRLWFHLFHNHLLSLRIRNIRIALLHRWVITKFIRIQRILLSPLTWGRACSASKTIILWSSQIWILSLVVVYIPPSCCILNLCPESLVHIPHSLGINWKHYFCCIIGVELRLMLLYLHVLISLDHLIHSVNFIWEMLAFSIFSFSFINKVSSFGL